MLVEYECLLEAYHVQYKANDGSRSCVMAWAWASARRDGLIVVAFIMVPPGHLDQRASNILLISWMVELLSLLVFSIRISEYEGAGEMGNTRGGWTTLTIWPSRPRFGYLYVHS